MNLFASLSTGTQVERSFRLMEHELSDPAYSLLARFNAYAGSVAMVAASTLLGLWLAPRWGTAPVDMIYLPAVLAAAALWGIGPGIAAGILAALTYNFFFTVPLHTLRIANVTDTVTVLVLLIVALVTSRLAAGIRAQARIADSHARRNATIAGFAGKLLSSSTEAEIAETSCAELKRVFGCNAMLVTGLPEPAIVAAVPTGNRLTPSDLAAAAYTLERNEPAGRGARRMQPAEWSFYPVHANGRVLAAMGLARDDGMKPVTEDLTPLLENLLDQLALALERARLEREAGDFASTRQRDRLRLSLLASIGDDLRPMADSLAASVRQLRRDGGEQKPAVSEIDSAVLKFRRYIDNLVDVGVEGEQLPIIAGPITIDLFRRTVVRDGQPVHLTPKEYAVLAELAKHRGRVLSHAHLLRAVWGPAQEQQVDYLRVAIRALRQKLESDPASPRLIVNEPGVGYRLVASDGS